MSAVVQQVDNTQAWAKDCNEQKSRLQDRPSTVVERAY